MPDLTNEQRIATIAACTALVNTVVATASDILLSEPATNTPLPYHTSALSGIAWVHELLNGHPDRIKNELGVRKHVQ